MESVNMHNVGAMEESMFLLDFITCMMITRSSAKLGNWHLLFWTNFLIFFETRANFDRQFFNLSIIAF